MLPLTTTRSSTPRVSRRRGLREHASTNGSFASLKPATRGCKIVGANYFSGALRQSFKCNVKTSSSRDRVIDQNFHGDPITDSKLLGKLYNTFQSDDKLTEVAALGRYRLMYHLYSKLATRYRVSIGFENAGTSNEYL